MSIAGVTDIDAIKYVLFSFAAIGALQATVP
jgi:hypothetical protein